MLKKFIMKPMSLIKNLIKKFILCKCPWSYDKFFGKEYKDYKKIFIIRNPLFVFSSLNKRFEYAIRDDHNFDCYINALTKFIKAFI